MGVIDAYRIATKEVPELQLALVGSMATDDPEGWEFFQHTYEYAENDPDIKILNNLNNVGAIEVNAFQSQSDVLMQKSIREGFGLTVTEGAVEGPADDRRATSAASRFRSSTARAASWSPAPSRRPSARSRSSRTRAWASTWAARARSGRASAS